MLVLAECLERLLLHKELVQKVGAMEDDDDDCQITGFVIRNHNSATSIKMEEEERRSSLDTFRSAQEIPSRNGTPSPAKVSLYDSGRLRIVEEEQEEELDYNEDPEPDPPTDIEVSSDSVVAIEQPQCSTSYLKDVRVIMEKIKKEKGDRKDVNRFKVQKVIQKKPGKGDKEYFKEIAKMISEEYKFKALSEASKQLIYAEIYAASPETTKKMAHLASRKLSRQLLELLLKIARASSVDVNMAEYRDIYISNIFGRQPDTLNFAFAKFAGSDGVLNFEFVKDVHQSNAISPLGCAFDEKIGFIFTGGDKVFSCSETGENLVQLVTGVKNPSGVCAVIFGEAFAFLSDEGVNLYDFRSKNSTLLFKVHKSRGLAVTDEGNLVFAKKSHSNGSGCFKIAMLDPTMGEIIYTLEIPGGAASLPSFLGIRDNYIFVTDLGQKKLHVFKASASKLTHESSTNVSKYSMFPAGIVIDNRHEILLAAAEERNIWLFNASLRKASKLSPETFPYSSGISFSPNGYLMACCRKSHGVRLFKAAERTLHEDFSQISL